MNRWSGIVLMLAAVQPGLAAASAAKVLFAVGRVEVSRGGQVLPLTRGSTLEVGDTVSTGPTGMTQLRFSDGALMSLRGGSAMTVEAYELPKAMPVAAAPALLVSSLPPGASKPDTGGAGRSVLRLVRGAFRTITGLIGKGQGDDYRVLTPAATIGIRGTDYTAAYCEGDCPGSEDGLYVGVSKGEVNVSNDAGEQQLGQNEYSHTRDAGSAPEQQTAPPEALEVPIEAPPAEGEDSGNQPEAGVSGYPEDSSGTYVEGGAESGYDTGTAGTETQAPVTEYQLQPGIPASFAFAHNDGNNAVRGAGDNGVYLEDGTSTAAFGFLTDAFYSIGSASNVNQGHDEATGLRWGRWAGGTGAAGAGTLDLSTANLHWVYAETASIPVIPAEGYATYRLVGNTDPTDASGNVGYLGTADLFADFSALSVSVDISLSINDQPLNGNGFGNITGNVFTGSLGAGGTFDGFFTNGAGAAGLSYTFDNGVTGAAAFEQSGYQVSPPAQ